MIKWEQDFITQTNMTTTWTVYTNANLFIEEKEKKKIGKYTAKLTFLWYDNFGKKERSLHRNGVAAIPKMELVHARRMGACQLPTLTEFKFT